MFRTSKVMWARVVFTFLTSGMFGLGMTLLAFGDDSKEKQPAVLHHDDVKNCKKRCATKAITAGKSMAGWGPRPGKEFASIRRLKICRSQDILIPRLPANSVSDRNR